MVQVNSGRKNKIINSCDTIMRYDSLHAKTVYSHTLKSHSNLCNVKHNNVCMHICECIEKELMNRIEISSRPQLSIWILRCRKMRFRVSYKKPNVPNSCSQYAEFGEQLWLLFCVLVLLLREKCRTRPRASWVFGWWSVYCPPCRKDISNVVRTLWSFII